MLEKPFRAERPNDPPARVADLCRISFRCLDPHASIELRGDWPGNRETRSRLLSALDRALEEACNDLMDAEQLDSRGRSPFNDPDLCHDPDALDEEFHDVDLFRGGWRRSPPDEHDQSFAPVVRLLTWLWGKVAEENPDRARLLAADSITRPSTMFRRMAFWCALVSDKGPLDQAMRVLGDIEPTEFQSYRNAEFARFWCLRWDELPPGTRHRIENGILTWADWAADGAGDAETRQRSYDWHLLLETGRIVTQGGAISATMATRRAEAALRLPRFPERVGISEGLYSSSFSFSGLSGDLGAIEGIPTGDLIEAVDKLERERSEQENLWEILCRNQPDQAWEALLARSDWPGRRWRQFLSAYDLKVQVPSPSEVLSRILDMPPACLSETLTQASWLIRTTADSEAFADWPLLLVAWERVWEQLAIHDDGSGDITDYRDLHMHALNAPAGKLAWALIDMLRKRGGEAGLGAVVREMVDKLLSLPDQSKILALAILAPHLGYLHRVEEEWTIRTLVPFFEADNALGRALLAGWASGSGRAPRLFARLKQPVERALVESASGSKPPAPLAHLVAWAAFRTLSDDKDIGITQTDARRMLTRCPAEILGRHCLGARKGSRPGGGLARQHPALLREGLALFS